MIDKYSKDGLINFICNDVIKDDITSERYGKIEKGFSRIKR
jgi:hypothetical protein